MLEDLSNEKRKKFLLYVFRDIPIGLFPGIIASYLILYKVLKFDLPVAFFIFIIFITILILAANAIRYYHKLKRDIQTEDDENKRTLKR